MVLVTVLSLISFSNTDVENIGIPNLDKLVHFTFYFVATILGCLFVRERTAGRMKMPKAALVFLVVNIIYGILIEIIQLSPNFTRDGNVYDAIANSVGALVGVGVVFMLFSEKRGLRWKV